MELAQHISQRRVVAQRLDCASRPFSPTMVLTLSASIFRPSRVFTTLTPFNASGRIYGSYFAAFVTISATVASSFMLPSGSYLSPRRNHRVKNLADAD